MAGGSQEGLAARQRAQEAEPASPCRAKGGSLFASENHRGLHSHDRVFDVIVMSRPDADTASLHNRAIESGSGS
jgi:hypothetical protein